MFAFDLKDASGDIRITAFKAECDKFFDLIKVDEVYLVSRGAIKNANKQFNHSTSEYEITLNQESVIENCSDASGCPEVRYDFKPLDDLLQYNGGFVDICVIIKEIHDVDTIIAKNTNKELLKRSIVVLDQSKCEVELALWGEEANNFRGEVDDALVIRGVRVSDFNNVSLSTTQNSTIELNPSLEEVHVLKGWYTRVKDGLEIKRLTEKKSGNVHADWNNIVEITPENVASDTGFLLQTKAVIYQMGKCLYHQSGN